jgi:predicted phosphodiesterase
MPEIFGVEVTTVADDEIVLHYVEDGKSLIKSFKGLKPDSEVEIGNLKIKTLQRPSGELLCKFATVNDIHIGEKTAGLVEGFSDLEGLSSDPDKIPYPIMMSVQAVKEISQINPEVVLAKGDLTSEASDEEFEKFLNIYGETFKDKLYYVRGNHDAKLSSNISTKDLQVIDLPGVKLVMIDTSIEDQYNGQVTDDQIESLDQIAHDYQGNILVFGHHQIWNPESRVRPETYFGVKPDDSERFVELMAKHNNLKGYFAGHTHRNRVRRFKTSGDKPYAEIAAVKDFPGSWAEYRVYETGVLQIHRRLSSDECLNWSDKCRSLYGGRYAQYSFGEIEDRCLVLD